MSGSYQVIARKWRPQTFDDVVGQDHVVRTLKNAITRNRIAHGYAHIDVRIIRATVDQDLPQLEEALRAELGRGLND